MAFNLSITKEGNVNWTELCALCEPLDRDFVTVYPIQRNGFLNESGIGLSIKIKSDYSLFWSDFSAVLKALMKDGFQVVELYDGTVIEPGQIAQLKKLIEG